MLAEGVLAREGFILDVGFECLPDDFLDRRHVGGEGGQGEQGEGGCCSLEGLHNFLVRAGAGLGSED